MLSGTGFPPPLFPVKPHLFIIISSSQNFVIVSKTYYKTSMTISCHQVALLVLWVLQLSPWCRILPRILLYIIVLATEQITLPGNCNTKLESHSLSQWCDEKKWLRYQAKPMTLLMAIKPIRQPSIGHGQILQLSYCGVVTRMPAAAVAEMSWKLEVGSSPWMRL